MGRRIARMFPKLCDAFKYFDRWLIIHLQMTILVITFTYSKIMSKYEFSILLLSIIIHSTILCLQILTPDFFCEYISHVTLSRDYFLSKVFHFRIRRFNKLSVAQIDLSRAMLIYFEDRVIFLLLDSWKL